MCIKMTTHTQPISILLMLLLAWTSSMAQVKMDLSVEDCETSRPLAGQEILLYCDGNTSVLSAIADRSGRVLFDKVPTGWCYVGVSHYRPLLLRLSSDTVIQSLCLVADPQFFSPVPRHCYTSRQAKEQALRSEAEALAANLDYEDGDWWSVPNYQRLAWLYYQDFIYPLPQWRTFAADSALFWLKNCYLRDPQRWGYMYYAICQVEHALGAEHDNRVVSPEASAYCALPQLPEGWQDDPHQDYVTYFESPYTRSSSLAKVLDPMGEKSLVGKGAGVMRFIVSSPDGTAESYRLEKGKVEYRRHRSADSLEDYEARTLPAKHDDVKRLQALAAAFFERLQTATTTATEETETYQLERTTERGHRLSDCATPGQEPLLDSIAHILAALRRANTATISLDIYDPSGNRPLRGSLLTLENESYRQHVYSPDSSHISIHLVPKGTYVITISHRYYATLEASLKVKRDNDIGKVRLRHKKYTAKKTPKTSENTSE